MGLQPNASAARVAQFIPVTGQQYSISSPPLSPSHWHYHKLTVQSICACNDLCKSNLSMCTQKKVPACFQQLFSVKSGPKMTINQSPLLLSIWLAEAVGTPPQPPPLLGAPRARRAGTHVPGGKPQGTENRAAQHGSLPNDSGGHQGTPDQATGADHPMNYQTPAWNMGMHAERAKPRLPNLITLVVEVKAFEIQFLIVFSMLAQLFPPQHHWNRSAAEDS